MEDVTTRSVPVRWRLLALVLVPLLAVLAQATVLVAQRVGQARSSATAVTQVRAAVALDELRARVAQEAVPVVSAVLVPGAGIRGSASATTTPDSTARLFAEARARTDAAVDTVSEDPLTAEEAQDAAATLAGLRSALTSDADSTTTAAADASLFANYSSLVATLTAAVDAHLEDARLAADDPRTAKAVADLRRVALTTTLASAEVPLYLGLRSATPTLEPTARTAFLESWAGWRHSSADVSVISGAQVRTAWAEATHAPAALALADVLDAAVLDPSSTATALDAQEIWDLNARTVARDDALHTALDEAAGVAVAESEQQAGDVQAALRRSTAVALSLVVGTLLAAAFVSRSITRPLGRLAGDAQAISEGRLVDVRSGGPRETRTAAAGLAAAVANLRQVQAQAQAVTDGDLEAEVLRSPQAGPLGEVVHSSVQQMLGALRERERLRAELAHEASHDSLTRLPNRASATFLAERAMHRADRAGTRVGLLFIDLDHFKRVNDTLGHAAGDQVLRTVAQRLRSRLRGGDVVARLGGDEFVVLVEPVPDEQSLVELGRSLVQTISDPIALAGENGRTALVGASIGVAVSRPGPVDAERLLHEADVAAYRAKNAGRGTVELFDDALRAALERQEDVERALRLALLGDELVLHYQPVVSLRAPGAGADEVTSLEALVRWERPGHGLVSPAEFIGVAEASDLVCDLGAWVLRTATAQLAAFDRAGGAAAGLSVAVNVSGRHLRSPRLPIDVEQALAASGISPHRLTIEVTETVLVDEPAAVQRISALRELGVKVAIDDFGTGYTSIGQLAHLPVDVLKVDRGLVASDDPRTADLVRLVVSAAHQFDLSVVAEGVEEPGQVRFLRSSGCDAVQGFLFARPVPAADVCAAVEGALRPLKEVRA